MISVLDNSKIDRNTGAQSFEALVTEGLLLKDYFIITNTHRPILCYAKVLPTNDDEREKLSKKLRIYNIQVSDYIEVSRSIGVQIPSQLSTIGTELLMKFPYSNNIKLLQQQQQQQDNLIMHHYQTILYRV
ncbi:unnamed protein product [Rotaria socialis]|uniref:Uncharacterized protein n=1 Tax=Rotaria socialis TaxID=392032 RepID=A0A821VQ12_9BILA|nr:unnamed protein product [Rotaria socialis]